MTRNYQEKSLAEYYSRINGHTTENELYPTSHALKNKDSFHYIRMDLERFPFLVQAIHF